MSWKKTSPGQMPFYSKRTSLASSYQVVRNAWLLGSFSVLIFSWAHSSGDNQGCLKGMRCSESVEKELVLGFKTLALINVYVFSSTLSESSLTLSKLLCLLSLRTRFCHLFECLLHDRYLIVS